MNTPEDAGGTGSTAPHERDLRRTYAEIGNSGGGSLTVPLSEAKVGHQRAAPGTGGLPNYAAPHSTTPSLGGNRSAYAGQAPLPPAPNSLPGGLNNSFTSPQAGASQGYAALDSGREIRPDIFRNSMGEPRGAPAFGVDSGVNDVDVTVMAYAQWISEMKQQATNARYQHQAELDLMRDAINANNGELVDFKRHSSSVVQQLQSQVTELRAKLSDTVAELSQLARQRAENEKVTAVAITELREAVGNRQMEVDTGRRGMADQLERLRSEVDNRMRHVEGDMSSLKKAVSGGQEQTIMKFGEVDKAMSMFHGTLGTSRQELTDTQDDWKKSQELMGKAISTLSQDMADFHKHTSTVLNKLQSDVYHLEEVGRETKDRLHRSEAQVTGMQQSMYNTANELILLRSDKDDASSQAGSVFRTPPAKRETSGGFGESKIGAMEKVNGSTNSLSKLLDHEAGLPPNPPDVDRPTTVEVVQAPISRQTTPVRSATPTRAGGSLVAGPPPQAGADRKSVV